MNRNFAKISVVIVALMLVLAFCLTGCKVDDVAADLDTTKGEVSANKADAAKALEEAVKALEAKIAANEADCAAEIAAVNAAIKAAKDASAVTDANLEAAEKTLNAAIAAVRESLDATKTELSNKITANDAKINAEVAALNKAIANAEAALKAADTANSAKLEASLNAAKAELDLAIKLLKADIAKLTEYVDAAVAALEADIAAGKKDLTSAVVELTQALDIAAAQSADADAALKADLEQSIAKATQAIIEVVEIADKNLQGQIDADKADLEATKELLNTLKNDTVPAIDAAYKKADGELAEKIEALKTELVNKIDAVNKTLGDRIAALEEALGGYKDATAAIDAAWAEICATYDSWKALSATHGADAKVNDAVEKAYELAQIRLGRAMTVKDVEDAKVEFAAAVAEAQRGVGTLKNLEDVYNSLVAAGNAADVVAERAALLAAKAGLDGVTDVELVVDGKVVDLAKKYAEACVAYNAERVALAEADIAAAQTAIGAAKTYDEIASIETSIGKIETAIKALVEDTDIPVETTTTDALAADHVELLKDVAAANIEIVYADIVAGKLDVDFAEAAAKIETAKAAGADVAALEARIADVKAARATAYADLANTAIENATDIATLDAAMKQIEENLTNAKADILSIADSAARKEAVAKYVAAQQAKLAKMETVVSGAISNATTLEDVAKAETYKETEIQRVILQLIFDEVGVDINNFGMTYSNLSMAAAEKVLAIAANAIETATSAEAVEAVTKTLDAAKTKIDALAADGTLMGYADCAKRVEDMAAKYDHLTALVALVAEGEDVAAIIAGLDATKLQGVKAEYDIINKYKTAKADFIAKLDKLYVGFEGKAGYDAIRATANEAGFEKIDTAFVEKISGLVEIASDLITKMKTINAKIAVDGYSFAMIVDIDAAWDAFHTWEQNAIDADGVGFIIEYVSEGEYTNENLNTVLVQLQAGYDEYVKEAQDAWAIVNTEAYQKLTVENLTWNETILTPVRAWFNTYGTDAADYDVVKVGTADDEAALKALETKLAELKAGRADLVAKLAEQADELQTAIDELGFITTDSKAAVEALRAEVESWKKAVADNAIDFAAEHGSAVTIDETDLAAAEAKLVALGDDIADIKAAIAALAIPTKGDDLTAPYFADVAAKDAYVAQVKAITDALAAFEKDNDGYRANFTEAELAKVEEANPELFVAKYEAALKVYNAYVDACNGVSDADVTAKMTTYLNEALKQIDKTTDNIAYIQQTGVNAASKFADIKEFEGLPVCTVHTFDYPCDTFCDVCFYTRTISENDHVYTNECDAVCDNCKEKTRDRDHTYDSVCDAVCNVCSERRTAPHIDANEDYKCDLCKTKMLPAAGTTLTVKQAIAVAKAAGSSYSSGKYYITGIVTGLYNTTYGNFYIKDAEGNQILIYGLYSSNGGTRYDKLPYKPVNGDEITVYTKLGTYNSSPQGKNAWLDDVVPHECDYDAVVTDPTCTKSGYTTYTCPGCGDSYVDDEVDALGHTVDVGTCERCGKEVGGAATVEELAVFQFGANGSAKHEDGSDLGTSKSYTEGGYTLSLTGMSKVFGPAYDAKGNSCIKLGTSSVVGTFKFTVPDNVTEVVIYIAQYKSNTTKIDVNGAAYSITTASNNGAYTAITVDTTTTKTVTFKTVSGGARCMIDSIVFNGYAK